MAFLDMLLTILYLSRLEYLGHKYIEYEINLIPRYLFKKFGIWGGGMIHYLIFYLPALSIGIMIILYSGYGNSLLIIFGALLVVTYQGVNNYLNTFEFMRGKNV